MNNGWNDKEPEEANEKANDAENENLKQAAEPQDLYFKQSQKSMKQELKLQCLKLALSADNGAATQERITTVIERAQTFYDFARR